MIFSITAIMIFFHYSNAVAAAEDMPAAGVDNACAAVADTTSGDFVIVSIC